jgi:hypothetical protein
MASVIKRKTLVYLVSVKGPKVSRVLAVYNVVVTVNIFGVAIGLAKRVRRFKAS